jgi:serine/threonine protein kinase
MAGADGSMWRDNAIRQGDIVRDPGTGEEYLVLDLIGRGAYAEVYRAQSVQTGELFALKVLQLHRAANPKVRERHRREGEILLRLRHPNLVRVHAIIADAGGRVIMVMDLLVGRTLARLRVDCQGKLPVNTAIEVALQVCSALEAVHDVEVVHRDIKPDNIFVGDDGIVRLCDLGVSQFPHEDRITTEDTTIGTVEFMSPEQLYTPHLVGPRTDLFALGVVLYESIAGVSPFAVEGKLSPNVKELGLQIIFRPHVPLRVAAPETPPHLADIVECLLAKEPGDRYESAAVTRELLATSHGRCLLELEERNVEPPRISFVGRLPPVPPIDTDQVPVPAGSANPFVSVSLPPEEPSRARALPTRGADHVSGALVRTEQLPVGTVEMGRPAIFELSPPSDAGPSARGAPMTVKMPAHVIPVAQASFAGPRVPSSPVETTPPVPPWATEGSREPPAGAPVPPTEEMPTINLSGRRETSSTPAVTLPARPPLPSTQHEQASAPAGGPSGESDTASSVAVVLAPTPGAAAPWRAAAGAPASRPARGRSRAAWIGAAVALTLALAVGVASLSRPALSAKHSAQPAVTLAPSTSSAATLAAPPVPSATAPVLPAAAPVPSVVAAPPPVASLAPPASAHVPRTLPVQGTSPPASVPARGQAKAVVAPQGAPPAAPPASAAPPPAPTQAPNRLFGTQN